LNLTDEDNPIDEISRIEAQLEELGLREMSKDHIGFQGGNRRRRRIVALHDARPVRIQSGRRDRIDCRGARRNRVARVERQYFATDDGRNERRRRAPFGSDQQDRPSNGW
jgi:hypothetical protein